MKSISNWLFVDEHQLYQSITFSDEFHLSNVSIVTDLGINIDSNLSHKSHISTIFTKSIQRVGIFFRGFSSRRFDIVRKTFISYIRALF